MSGLRGGYTVLKITSIASSSKGNCYLIEAGNSTLMIDCGVPLSRVREHIPELSKVDACLVSHEHGDHANFLPKLEAETPIDIYCTQGTKKRFNLNMVSYLQDRVVFDIKRCFRVMPLKLNHDVQCFGFLIWVGNEKLFYATDTSEVNYQFPGLTHLMIESNYSFEKLIESEHNKSVVRRICETHLSIDQVAEFVKRHKDLTEIHLLHLSSANSDERLFKETIQDLSGAVVYVANE
jgi:phosphoribosyl 1,2-cyclic phosphodiesterase